MSAAWGVHSLVKCPEGVSRGMYSKHYWCEEASEPWVILRSRCTDPLHRNPNAFPSDPNTKKPKTAKPIPNPSHPTTPPMEASLLAITPANPPPILKLPSKPTHTPRPNSARKPTAIPVGADSPAIAPAQPPSTLKMHPKLTPMPAAWKRPTSDGQNRIGSI